MKPNGDWSPTEAVSNKLEITVDEKQRYDYRGDKSAQEPGRQYEMRIPDFDRTRSHVEEATDAPVKAYNGAVADLMRQATNAKT